jgi:hypothetical protein
MVGVITGYDGFAGIVCSVYFDKIRDRVAV